MRPEAFDLGARLRARRLQMQMTAEEVAGIIDLDGTGLVEIEAGRRGLSQSDHDGLMTYLCVSEDYLSGSQTLEELVGKDETEAAEMLANIVAAYWKLPNHLARKVAYAEAIDFLNGMPS